MVRSYWWMVFKRAAWEAAVLLGLDQPSRIVVRVLLALVILLALALWGTEGAAGDEILARGIVAGIVLLSFPLVLIWKLARSPAAIHDDLTTRVANLEERLEANLTITLPPDRGAVELNIGKTNMTQSGRLQSVFTDSRTMICLNCTNEGESAALGCVARVLRAWRVESDGSNTDLGVVESVPLAWARDLTMPNLQADIHPHDTRRIFVAAAHPAGSVILYRNFDDMPIEYHQLMPQPGGHWRLLIQVDFGYGDRKSKRIILDIQTEAAADRKTALHRAQVRLAIVNDDATPPPIPGVAA